MYAKQSVYYKDIKNNVRYIKGLLIHEVDWYKEAG